MRASTIKGSPWNPRVPVDPGWAPNRSPSRLFISDSKPWNAASESVADKCKQFFLCFPKVLRRREKNAHHGPNGT